MLRTYNYTQQMENNSVHSTSQVIADGIFSSAALEHFPKDIFA